MIMPLRVRHLEVHESGEDVLVHDRVQAKIHVLNRAAGEVLRACDGQTSLDAVAHAFAAQDPAQAVRDVERVLRDFSALGLIDA